MNKVPNTAVKPYVLLELQSMGAVNAPIRNSQRVKYTCFDVSRRYIIFGSSSGGIYVFLRENLQYLKIITNKDGPVSQVALAPDDSILAFATSRGHVLVVEHNAEREGSTSQRLQFTYEHKGSLVTTLKWSNTPSRLYAGDDSGRVSLINVSLSRTRSLFQVPSSVLMKVDSRIVQIDHSKDYLLVSSLTRSYVYNTITEQWVQIGKKMREGMFGACLYPGPRYQDSCTVFASRPGARLWEADLFGNVVSTHQFKGALAIPPAKLYSYRLDQEFSANSSSCSSGQSRSLLGFTQLHTLWPSSDTLPFLLTWNAQGIYVLNPKKVEVLLRIDTLTAIKTAACYKSSIYVQHERDQFCHLSLLPLEQAIKELVEKRLYLQSAELLLQQAHHFLRAEQPVRLQPSFVSDLVAKLNETGHADLADRLVPFQNALKKHQVPSAMESPPSETQRSPRRPRSALAVSSRRTSPKPCRCRSASPLQRSRPSLSSNSFIPIRTPPATTSPSSSSLSEEKKQESLERSKTDLTNSLPNSFPTSLLPSTQTVVRGLDTSKSFPQLLLNDFLSPVDEGKSENSPVTSFPSHHSTLPDNQLPHYESDDDTSSTSEISRKHDNEARNENTSDSDQTSDNYEMSYRLLCLSVHGGGVVFPPGFDLLASSELGEVASLDLGKMKESISSTFTSGKKTLMQNFRDLESKFKQLSDSSSSRLHSPSGFSSPCRTPEPLDEAQTINAEMNYLYDCSFWESVPSVDLHLLFEATAEASNRLRDPDLLFDALGQQRALQDWMAVLNATQREILKLAHAQDADVCDNEQEMLQEVNGNTVIPLSPTTQPMEDWNGSMKKRKAKLRSCPVMIHCPFKISPEVHQQMATLAKICFRTANFGSNLEGLSAFFSCTNCWEDLSNAPLDRRKSSKKDQNGNERKENPNSVLFVRNYFHLLGFDGKNCEELFDEWITLNEETARDKETRYHTWCTLIRGFQLMSDDALFARALISGNVTLAAEQIVEPFRVTRYTVAKIVQLARLDYKKTLEVCIKLCQQMSAVDILYISRCTKFHPNLFLNCIEELLKNFSDVKRSQSYRRLFWSREVRIEWMRCVLEHHPPTTNGDTPILKCQSCGKPMPGSHLHPWPFGRELLQVLDIFGSSDQDSSIVSKLCHDNGFWPGLLLLLRKRQEKEKHLETLLLLDDGRLLSNSHPLGCLPEDMTQWSLFLNQLMNRRLPQHPSSGECLHCGSQGSSVDPDKPCRLTLDLATRRMLLVFRPAQVLRLLRSLRIPIGRLSSTTYRATILTHLINAQQNILSHSMLARLESYLWSRRSIAIPPQVWKVLEEEKSARTEKNSPLTSESPSTPLELRQRYLRYLEEPENHWGVSTQLQRSCPLCGIPLCSHMPSGSSVSKVTGVTVGSCGHAFHSNCVGQTAAPCPICIDRRPSGFL